MAEPAEGEGAGEIVTLALDSESALVLFGMLSREIDGNNARRLMTSCRSEAELWALNSLLCTLESRLVMPFSPGAFDAAGERLVERCGPWPHDDDNQG